MHSHSTWKEISSRFREYPPALTLQRDRWLNVAEWGYKYNFEEQRFLPPNYWLYVSCSPICWSDRRISHRLFWRKLLTTGNNLQQPHLTANTVTTVQCRGGSLFCLPSLLLKSKYRSQITNFHFKKWSYAGTRGLLVCWLIRHIGLHDCDQNDNQDYFFINIKITIIN